MMHRIFIFSCFLATGVLSVDDNTNFPIQHADGVFDDNPESIRVRIQVEQPVLVDDIMRMELDAARENNSDACSDFYRYCDATGAQYDPLKLQCSCEENCDLFGNCCWDSPSKGHREKIANCYNIPEYEVGFYLMDHCPVSWNQLEVRTFCESKNTSFDPFASIPISSPGTTYKNVYCAICNDELQSLQPWEFKLQSCQNNSLRDCIMDAKVPENVTVIPCDQNAISECPDKNDPNSKNCELYYAPVKDGTNNSITYKNKFCAFCRGIEELKCVEPLYTGLYVPTRLSASFSIIFHVDFWHGSRFVGGYEDCYQVPELPVCKEVTCQNGVCTINVTDTSKLVTASCTKWILDGIEYILDEKGELSLFNESLISNKTVCDYYITFGPDQPLLTIVCISISIICLIIKIILFLFVEKNKKLSQQAIFMLCVSVLSSQFLFVIGSNETQWGIACVVIGVLMHYLFLVSLFWTNILSFDIWRTFSTMANTVATSPTRRFIHYNMYCWICPLLLVILAMVFEWGIGYEPLQPGYGLNFCWISRKLPLLVFFVCPLGVLLCVNVFLFTWTACRISTAVRAARVARDTAGPDKIRFILYFKLAFIMGLTWVFGFSAAYVDSDVMWCFFIVLNALQGAFLLLAFSRLRFKVYFVRLRMFVRKATHSTNSRSTKSSQDYSTSKM